MTSSTKSGRVLLADCHLNMLGGVYRLLADWFETVLMVADEPSLLDAVATVKPDLVVLDMSLPGAEEANVARRLKIHCPELRLVVLSVHDEPTVARQLLDGGAAAFVLKRTAAMDLLPAVRKVLRGGTYVSPALHLSPGARGLDPNPGPKNPEVEQP